MLPESLLSHIFSYMSPVERWRAARVSRTWYRLVHDPHLYRDIILENLEFRTLVLALQKIIDINPRIRSLVIDGCYSDFVRHTVVPVHFANREPQQPMLFSQLRSLQPARRRQEYLNHGFELHDQFSDSFSGLLKANQQTLVLVDIRNCDLDFEMTEIFCTVARFGVSLNTFIYTNNGDNGVRSAGLLKAIIISCPKMRHFRGHHAGMDDIVVLTIVRHWPQLESLTLCSLKSADALDQAALVNQEGRELQGTSLMGSISGRAFFELLCKCTSLHSLELYDLACITNRDLAMYQNMKHQISTQARLESRKPHYQPYILPKSIRSATSRQSHSLVAPPLPGASLRSLCITKYTTTPLSKPGFESLLKLFPRLDTLEYATNFYTFDIQFQDVTRCMFEAEQAAVSALMTHQDHLVYHQKWNEPMTTDQRLMAGMMSVSSDSTAL